MGCTPSSVNSPSQFVHRRAATRRSAADINAIIRSAHGAQLRRRDSGCGGSGASGNESGAGDSVYVAADGVPHVFLYGRPVGFSGASEVLACFDDDEEEGNLYRLVRGKLLSIGYEEAEAATMQGSKSPRSRQGRETDAQCGRVSEEDRAGILAARERQEGLRAASAVQSKRDAVVAPSTDTAPTAAALQPRDEAEANRQVVAALLGTGSGPRSAPQSVEGGSAAKSCNQEKGEEAQSGPADGVMESDGMALLNDASPSLSQRVNNSGVEEWCEEYTKQPQEHYSDVASGRQRGAASLTPQAFCPPSTNTRVPLLSNSENSQVKPKSTSSESDASDGNFLQRQLRFFNLSMSEMRTWAFFNDSPFVMHIVTVFDGASVLEARDSTRVWQAMSLRDAKATPDPPPLFFGLFCDSMGGAEDSALDFTAVSSRRRNLTGTKTEWVAELLVPPLATRLFVEGKVKGAYNMRCTRLTMEEVLCAMQRAAEVAEKRRSGGPFFTSQTTRLQGAGGDDTPAGATPPLSAISAPMHRKDGETPHYSLVKQSRDALTRSTFTKNAMKSTTLVQQRRTKQHGEGGPSPTSTELSKSKKSERAQRGDAAARETYPTGTTVVLPSTRSRRNSSAIVRDTATAPPRSPTPDKALPSLTSSARAAGLPAIREANKRRIITTYPPSPMDVMEEEAVLTYNDDTSLNMSCSRTRRPASSRLAMTQRQHQIGDSGRFSFSSIEVHQMVPVGGRRTSRSPTTPPLAPTSWKPVCLQGEDVVVPASRRCQVQYKSIPSTAKLIHCFRNGAGEQEVGSPSATASNSTAALKAKTKTKAKTAASNGSSDKDAKRPHNVGTSGIESRRLYISGSCGSSQESDDRLAPGREEDDCHFVCMTLTPKISSRAMSSPVTSSWSKFGSMTIAIDEGENQSSHGAFAAET